MKPILWLVENIAPTVLALGASALGIAYTAFTLYMLWGWLAVPHLSASPMGYGQALAACVFFEWVRANLIPSRDAKEKELPANVEFGRFFMVCFSPLLFGYLLSIFL